MKRVETFFRGLTAGDVMQRTALVLEQGTRVDRAAQLLLTQRLGAAPVIDSAGQCVGVLSLGDILRWKLEGRPSTFKSASSVWCDWQVVDGKSAGRDDVVHCMKRDPLVVTRDTRLVAIARTLTDPHRRPVIVVDERRRPLGVLSSKSVLAALAFAERQPAKESFLESGTPTVGSINGQDLAEFAHGH